MAEEFSIGELLGITNDRMAELSNAFIEEYSSGALMELPKKIERMAQEKKCTFNETLWCGMMIEHILTMHRVK
jgi:hypothetical protein